MKILTCLKNVLLLPAMISAGSFCVGRGNPPKSQSPKEQSEGYYWYEAVFLHKEDVEAAFRTASDRFPNYEFVPNDFHVTTQFKPNPKHESLYGTAVTVHITGYISGSVQDRKEDLVSENEGFLVEISSADENMQLLLDVCNRIWHITGSYTGAAKYTEHLDFSTARPMDLTLEGVFGMADSSGLVILQSIKQPGISGEEI